MPLETKFKWKFLFEFDLRTDRIPTKMLKNSLKSAKHPQKNERAEE